jgi:Tfp pilus assembly protein PilF
VPIRSIRIDAAWKTAVLTVAALALIPAVWIVVRWSMAGSAVQRADSAELAVYLTTLSPDDPQTHSTAARFLEKSFDPDDISKALHELETAAGLSPENYMAWLDLGRARERSGDAGGAEAALRRALELAPNYSRVQWALGNALLRQGRIDEAFSEIRKAVAGDTAFATPAAAAAWQFFDGDVGQIRRALDGSDNFNAALAVLLAREDRFDDAMEIWSTIPAAVKRTSLKETASVLLGRLLEAKKFRLAARVSSELGDVGVQPGQITNGGFESAVKPDGAGQFEWQIAAGLQPQIVLSTGQKHGGSNSLMLIFNSQDAKDFRPISQTVAVEPGRSYELELYYRSDVKTAAAFKWEVADTGEVRQLAATDALTPAAEWTRVEVLFRVPERSDGVIIRLLREGCGQLCSVTGSLWFDDFSIRMVEG